jgi:two-component system response regulator DevR
VAYECLTGFPPFVRQDPAALLWAQLNDQPAALSNHQPRLRSADPVVGRALAKKPGNRYQTCVQFTTALAEALGVGRQSSSDTATAAGVIPGQTGRHHRTDDDGRGDRRRTHWSTPSKTVSDRTLTVFLVDDHEMVRRGVADLLEAEDDLTVIGEASSAAEALTRIWELRPDVAVLDMRLPDGNGVELCRELRSLLPELNCLILTSFTDEEAVMDAILAGASGYVIKDIRSSELLTAVRTVGAGRSMLDSRATSAVLNRLRSTERPSGGVADLSEQERAVLDLIGRRLTNLEIAERLSLPEKTVKAYVSVVLAKLGVAKRTQAAAVASKLRERHHRTTT